MISQLEIPTNPIINHLKSSKPGMEKANNLSQLMQQQYLNHLCFELGLNLISIENSINNSKIQLSQIEHLVVKTTKLSKSINKLYKAS